MKIKIIIMIVVLSMSLIIGCIDLEKNQKEEIIPAERKLPEMENLRLFLEKDQTDKLKYNSNEGKNYTSAELVKILAENASENNIYLGAMFSRDTAGVGVVTRHSKPMNYAVIENKIIIINPANDQICYLDGISSDSKRYVIMLKDPKTITNFGKKTNPISLDLWEEYDEVKLAKEFKPEI